MADIVPVLLDFRFQGGDASFFDTNTFSPAPNTNLITVSMGIGQVTPLVTVPGLSGNGITYSIVATQNFDWAGVDRGILSVHRGLGAAPTSGVTRVQYTQNLFRHFVFVFQLQNTDIGNLGANLIVGTPAQAKIALGGGNNPSIAMPAAENPANSTMGFIGVAEGQPQTLEGIGFTILKVLGGTGPEPGLQGAEFAQVVRTLVDWNMGGDAENKALIAVELRNAVPFVEGAAPAVGGSAFVGGNLIT